MLKEIVPELNTSHPGDLHSKTVPSLKVAIRLGEQKTNGFFNFDDLLNMPGSDDIQKLHQARRKVSPDDPTSIVVR